MQMLTIDDVCRLLRISKVSLHKLRKSGVIPRPVYVGRLPRWRVSDLRHLLGD